MPYRSEPGSLSGAHCPLFREIKRERGDLSVGKRKEFIDYKTVLNYTGGDNRKAREAYKRFLIEGLAQDTKKPLEIGRGHGIIGDAEFIGWIKEKFISRDGDKREQPALRILEKEYKPSELIERYAKLVGLEQEQICKRGRRSVERAILIELLYRYCRITQSEIGKLVGGIDYSAVSNIRRRLRNGLEKKKQLSRRFKNLIGRLELT